MPPDLSASCLIPTAVRLPRAPVAALLLPRRPSHRHLQLHPRHLHHRHHLPPPAVRARKVQTRLSMATSALHLGNVVFLLTWRARADRNTLGMYMLCRSVSHGDLWNQRRALIAYFGTTQQPMYLHLRFLKVSPLPVRCALPLLFTIMPCLTAQPMYLHLRCLKVRLLHFYYLNQRPILSLSLSSTPHDASPLPASYCWRYRRAMTSLPHT